MSILRREYIRSNWIEQCFFLRKTVDENSLGKYNWLVLTKNIHVYNNANWYKHVNWYLHLFKHYFSLVKVFVPKKYQFDNFTDICWFLFYTTLQTIVSSTKVIFLPNRDEKFQTFSVCLGKKKQLLISSDIKKSCSMIYNPWLRGYCSPKSSLKSINPGVIETVEMQSFFRAS